MNDILASSLKIMTFSTIWPTNPSSPPFSEYNLDFSSCTYLDEYCHFWRYQIYTKSNAYSIRSQVFLRVTRGLGYLFGTTVKRRLHNVNSKLNFFKRKDWGTEYKLKGIVRTLTRTQDWLQVQVPKQTRYFFFDSQWLFRGGCATAGFSCSHFR